MTVVECDRKRARARSCVCGNPPPGTLTRKHGNTPRCSIVRHFLLYVLPPANMLHVTWPKSHFTSVSNVRFSHVRIKGRRFSSNETMATSPPPQQQHNAAWQSRQVFLRELSCDWSDCPNMAESDWLLLGDTLRRSKCRTREY